MTRFAASEMRRRLADARACLHEAEYFLNLTRAGVRRGGNADRGRPDRLLVARDADGRWRLLFFTLAPAANRERVWEERLTEMVLAAAAVRQQDGQMAGRRRPALPGRRLPHRTGAGPPGPPPHPRLGRRQAPSIGRCERRPKRQAGRSVADERLVALAAQRMLGPLGVPAVVEAARSSSTGRRSRDGTSPHSSGASGRGRGHGPGRDRGRGRDGPPWGLRAPWPWRGRRPGESAA